MTRAGYCHETVWSVLKFNARGHRGVPWRPVEPRTGQQVRDRLMVTLSNSTRCARSSTRRFGAGSTGSVANEHRHWPSRGTPANSPRSIQCKLCEPNHSLTNSTLTPSSSPPTEPRSQPRHHLHHRPVGQNAKDASRTRRPRTADRVDRHRRILANRLQTSPWPLATLRLTSRSQTPRTSTATGTPPSTPCSLGSKLATTMAY